MTEELRQARAREAALRSRLAGAVTERARARTEAERLEARSTLSGADAAVAEAAQQQRVMEAASADSIEELRAQVRRAEGEVVALEAKADAERSASAG